MRNLLLFMLLIGIFVVGKKSCSSSWSPFGGIKGEGALQTETRTVDSFQGVDLQISGEVLLFTGEEYVVQISAQGNLLPILKTEVEDGVLRIFSSENFNSSENIIVRVTAPSYRSLAVNSSGDIQSEAPLLAEKMTMSVAGSGEIRCTRATFGFLKSSISGSGEIEVDGKSDELEVNISGSGDFKGKSLTTNVLDASIAGSGTITADVISTLNAHVSGSGDVYYSGNPSVSSHVSGSGTVQKSNKPQ